MATDEDDGWGAAAPAGPVPRLEVLKTLGDNTRYAIYLELARAPRPLSTAEVADTLDLHPNTVRPHLERMREAGLVEVSTAATGAVGRPQHRFALAEGAPSLGLEPPGFPMLSRMLLTVAAAAGVDPDELVAAGFEQGIADAAVADPRADDLDALEARQGELGFDPTRAEEDGQVTIAFAHCPFRELAEAHPDLVCAIHAGMVEGFASCRPGCRVERFHPLIDREPCRVDLRRTDHAASPA